MRIVKEFSHGPLRCTLLHHNTKYTLRIEDEYGEVNYKLGSVDHINPDMIPEILNLPDLRNSLITAFRAMKTGRDLLSELISPQESSEFDEII